MSAMSSDLRSEEFALFLTAGVDEQGGVEQQVAFESKATFLIP